MRSVSHCGSDIGLVHSGYRALQRRPTCPGALRGPRSLVPGAETAARHPRAARMGPALLRGPPGRRAAAARTRPRRVVPEGGRRGAGGGIPGHGRPGLGLRPHAEGDRADRTDRRNGRASCEAGPPSLSCPGSGDRRRCRRPRGWHLCGRTPARPRRTHHRGRGRLRRTRRRTRTSTGSPASSSPPSSSRSGCAAHEEPEVRPARQGREARDDRRGAPAPQGARAGAPALLLARWGCSTTSRGRDAGARPGAGRVPLHRAGPGVGQERAPRPRGPPRRANAAEPSRERRPTSRRGRQGCGHRHREPRGTPTLLPGTATPRGYGPLGPGAERGGDRPRSTWRDSRSSWLAPGRGTLPDRTGN